MFIVCCLGFRCLFVKFWCRNRFVCGWLLALRSLVGVSGCGCLLLFGLRVCWF